MNYSPTLPIQRDNKGSPKVRHYTNVTITTKHKLPDNIQ